MVQEQQADFIDLNDEDYEDYRFQLLADAMGVEHYVMKKLAFYRTFPMTRTVWNVIKDLLNLQKSIQLGGPKMCRRALRSLRDRQSMRSTSTLAEWNQRSQCMSPGIQCSGQQHTMDGVLIQTTKLARNLVTTKMG